MKLNINRKTLLTIILLILFFPIPKQLDDYGSMSYHALTYKMIWSNELTYNEDGPVVGFGLNRGIKLSILGFQVIDTVRFIPESEVIREREKNQQIPEGGLY